jgi:hypothetical protein
MTQDFLGIYKDAYSDEYCNALISYYDSMEINGLTFHRDESTAIQKDDRCIYSGESYMAHGIMFKEFCARFWDRSYAEYQKRFNILNSIDHHQIYTVKIQKTKIGGGYHLWHCETGTRAESSRVLNFILYLNDVEDGGETEFLYYHKRIKPKKGTLILFPAGLTHTHRGNPPLSGNKYILTGWVEL